MKQFEGWVIKLKKKIKSSIGAKTFLSILVLLITCCIIIYGVVVYFLPKNYQTELETQFVSEFQTLVQNIEENGIEANTQDMVSFSVRNNASLVITEENGAEIYSLNTQNIEEKSSKDKTLNTVSKVKLNNQTYHINALASFVAVSQSYDILIQLLPLILALIILIAVIGAYLTSSYFSKPLIKICGVAKRMTKLDMTWKCDTSRADEIGILANSLNEMAERLNNALIELQRANEKLQEDIENERKQEQQRIEFFTSVSHELKTPITIIKGELEGMIYKVGEYKDRDTYLLHTLSTVETMEKLVKEILTSARMSGTDFQLNLEETNISSLVETCCQNIDRLTKEKEIKIHMNLPFEYMYLGDKKLLQSAFLNVITNAVLYSPKRADVFIKIYENVLSIENTGIHIEQEDLEQVFLPFFRADKSRNRNTGGSGLGLYLVKIILERHKIKYSIENTDIGVKFSVVFS